MPACGETKVTVGVRLVPISDRERDRPWRCSAIPWMPDTGPKNARARRMDARSNSPAVLSLSTSFRALRYGASTRFFRAVFDQFRGAPSAIHRLMIAICASVKYGPPSLGIRWPTIPDEPSILLTR